MVECGRACRHCKHSTQKNPQARLTPRPNLNGGHTMPNVRARSSALCNPKLTLLTTFEYTVGPRSLLNAFCASHRSRDARRTNRPKSKSLLPASATNTGQQWESQARDLWAILAGNVPTKVMELDLLGLVESRKQAFQSAQRAKRGACSGRPSSSLFEVRGSLHRF